MVACQICGVERHRLAPHLRHAHGLSSSEYLLEHPGAPLTSEHVRAIAADLFRDFHGPPYWTRDRIVAAIQRWARRTGKPPTRVAWEQPLRGLLSAEGPVEPKHRPSAATVVKVFGSWSAGIAAAGFEPRPPHGVKGMKWGTRSRTSRRRTAA